LKILFAASECVPFCKTGGLADVVGALPKELRKQRHDVRIILPKYRTVRGQEFEIKETRETVSIPMGARIEKAEIRQARTDKRIPVYFIHHEGYFGRSGLYRTSDGDYPDNGERFAFFSHAVLEACKAMQFRPDIIHVHDWQTGLIPAYLKTIYHEDSFFQHTATVMTVHNMAYQGVFSKNILPRIGFSWSEFTPEKLEYYDQLSFLKAGMVYADALTTVSPTYAKEIQTPEFGRGLQGVVQSREGVLSGILNGLDPDDWNPEKDLFLTTTFGADRMAGRVENKLELQRSLQLPVRADIPMLGIVSRLDPQKGMDLLAEILPTVLRSAQVVILGQGDPAIQERLEQFQQEFPESFRVRSDFNEPLAHKIYGGSDMFLMPSRFEPCGLAQLIAMRYGSVPVVSNTGGLRDTVLPVTAHGGTGFLFHSGDAAAFLGAIQEALHWYSDKGKWHDIQKRAMQTDFSWMPSTNAYLRVYRQTLGRNPTPRSLTPRS